MTDQKASLPQERRSTNGRRPQKRRQEILDAAAQVFYERGYDASSTQDIADVVGILKGSLYYYVDSKEQFLYEIIKEAHDLGLAILDEVRAADGDVVERFALLIRRHVEYFVANRIKVSVFFREYAALAPENRQEIEQLGHMYRECVEDLVREGQARGEVSPSVNADLAGITIVEMLNSVTRWYHPDGKASPTAIANQFSDLILAGLITMPARDERGGDDAFREALRSDVSPGRKG